MGLEVRRCGRGLGATIKDKRNERGETRKTRGVIGRKRGMNRWHQSPV